MPKANWGVSARRIDSYDRNTLYQPYSGKLPPAGVYRFKMISLRYAAGTEDRNPQLRVRLSLVPRSGRGEKAYAGYTVTAMCPITDNALFRIVPFLDVIGVSGSDFVNSTVYKSNGEVVRIGKWRNPGDLELLAQLKTSDSEEYPREVGTFLPLSEDDNEDVEDEFDEDNDVDDSEAYAADEDDEDDPWEEPKPVSRKRKRTRR